MTYIYNLFHTVLLYKGQKVSLPHKGHWATALPSALDKTCHQCGCGKGARDLTTDHPGSNMSC